MTATATLDRSDLDAQYRDLLTDVTFRPVFVMGDHRSGTTILYKILGATGCFNIVTVYDIARFNRLLYDHVNHSTTESKEELNNYLRQRGMQDRVFDRVSVDADTPEEYGFILRNGGSRPQLREDNVADLVALCQFLPGPASSQVGMALGLRRAGWLGLVAAFVGFTLPSALLLIAFAYGVAQWPALAASGAMHGLKVVAVAVVAQAVWGMSRTLCPDRPRAGIAFGAALLVVALPTAHAQLGAIVAGGLLGRWVLTLPPLPPQDHAAGGVSRRTGAALAAGNLARERCGPVPELRDDRGVFCGFPARFYGGEKAGFSRFPGDAHPGAGR